MDVDAVIRRAPELALVDELAHTNAPGMRNEKRWQDIEEVLDAGIDVISTVNVQHLESLNDAIFELTEVRVRETFPDRILDDADEVVLVDLSPEELQERLRAGKVYPRERADVALENFFRADKLARAPRARAARGGGGRGGAGAPRERSSRSASRRSPSACSRSSSRSRSRSASCAGPGARPSGSARRWTRSGCARPGRAADGRGDDAARGAPPARRHARRATSSRRRATTSSPRSAGSPHERGSTYIFVGTPDESRRREIFGGSLLSRMVRELPGLDIRVVANRADRDRLEPNDRRGRSHSPVSRPRSPPRSRYAAASGSAAAHRRLADPRALHRRHARPDRARGGDPARPRGGARPSSPPTSCSCRSATARIRPLRDEVAVALPLLEAVEHAALRAGVPVDARIEKGRSADPRAAAPLGRRGLRPDRRAGARTAAAAASRRRT